ncbi:MAG: RNA-directed DNA polymerase [Burkholderiales bacterium]|nr:RNA-directed DNA polymerase [Burkholderiales bacterium]
MPERLLSGRAAGSRGHRHAHPGDRELEFGRSGAVAPLSDRPDDVDSTSGRRSPATPATRGSRTSTTATRTTTTRTGAVGPAPSADDPAAPTAAFSFEDLVAAYFDCRRTKRNKPSALAFEASLERNLVALHDELVDGSYRPGPSICFVVTRPKAREVWAAAFRDRIVHHLLYNRIAPGIERTFIADSCACIRGRGTLYAAQRLEAKVRSVSANWSRPAYYLKCDLANFFVSIDKCILWSLLAPRIAEPWWRDLAALVLFHDPRPGVELRSRREVLARVPTHKQLRHQAPELGLPIGNLSSQFFANVYLDALDRFVKHDLRVRHYIRYVDDFVLLHESPAQLNAWLAAIAVFLPSTLHVVLNTSKTILQPVARGVDFVGHVIRPWRRSIRRRTLNAGLARVRELHDDELYQSINSYFGLLRQSPASHHERARLANLARQRGFSVARDLTKAYRRSGDAR